MKTMNFEQMEQINAGACGTEQALAWVGLLGLVAGAGSVVGVGFGLWGFGTTAYTYYKCLAANM